MKPVDLKFVCNILIMMGFFMGYQIKILILSKIDGCQLQKNRMVMGKKMVLPRLVLIDNACTELECNESVVALMNFPKRN